MGSQIEDSLLDELDSGVFRELGRQLGMDVPDDSKLIASMATERGGLGLKRTKSIASTAFTAARIEPEPMVSELFEGLDRLFGEPGRLMEKHDARTSSELSALEAALGPERQVLAHVLVAGAAVEASARYASLKAGSARVARQETAEPRLVLPAGVEDLEHLEQNRLQGSLCRLVDEECLAGLLHSYHVEGDWGAVRRLQEVGDPSVTHTWLRALHPVHGPVLCEESFMDAVRIRLGLCLLQTPIECDRCGKEVDRKCAHGQVCGKAECT